MSGKRVSKRLSAAQSFSGTHRQSSGPGDFALFGELMANGQSHMVLLGVDKAIVRDCDQALRTPIGILQPVLLDDLQCLGYQKGQRVNIQRKREYQEVSGVNRGEQFGLLLLPAQGCSEGPRLCLPAMLREAFQ